MFRRRPSNDPRLVVFPCTEDDFARALAPKEVFAIRSVKAGRVLRGRAAAGGFVGLADADPDVVRLAAVPLRLRIETGRDAVDFVPDFRVESRRSGVHLLHFVPEHPDTACVAAMAAAGRSGLRIAFVAERVLASAGPVRRLAPGRFMDLASGHVLMSTLRPPAPIEIGAAAC